MISDLLRPLMGIQIVRKPACRRSGSRTRKQPGFYAPERGIDHQPYLLTPVVHGARSSAH